MRHVSLETGADFVKGLFFITEERVSRLIAMLLDVTQKEIVVLIAGPIKDNEVLVGGSCCATKHQRRCSKCKDNFGRFHVTSPDFAKGLPITVPLVCPAFL